jgi:AcrR family transcriptional regulator
MDDIAHELGVTKGLLYYYFSNKGDVVYEINKRIVSRFIFKHVEQVDRAAGPADQLRQAIRAHVAVIGENPSIAKPLLESRMRSYASMGPERYEEMSALREQYAKLFEHIYIEGQKAGVFKPGNPKITVNLMLGSLNMIATWYRFDGPVRPDQLADIAADLLVRGVLEPASNVTQ